MMSLYVKLKSRSGVSVLKIVVTLMEHDYQADRLAWLKIAQNVKEA